MKCKNTCKPFFQIFVVVYLAASFIGCKDGEVEPTHPAHWDYENPDWQDLGYTDCGGVVQTPIDIETNKTIKTFLDDLTFDHNTFSMSIVDNGHTVQVNKSASAVNTLEVDGTLFNFVQFHYHTHSEHAIDGNYYPMELHFVHQDPLTDNLAVVGIFVEEDANVAANDFLEKYFANFPDVEMQEMQTTTPINLSDILPADRHYFTYTGSLTTPPCSQGLKWIVMKEPVKATPTQIHEFEEWHHVNARPLQPLNNRFVLEQL